MSLRAGVVVTGTEVVTGRISDRNGPWVSQRLGELGFEVARITCVGDRREDLLGALRAMRDDGLELIVTTGGLGPTADDLTAEVVAAFAGRPLSLDEEMERRIAAIVAGLARQRRFDPEALAQGTRKQALIPEGAVALDPTGTAPGLLVDARGAEGRAERGPLILVLPGPPRELQAMWPAALRAEPLARLLEGAEDYEVETMKMFGIPESTLAKSLREIEAEIDLSPLEITTCLRGGAELEIDVRNRVADAPLRRELFAALRSRHDRHIYTERGESIDELLAAQLQGRRIGLAESCTGGGLAERLTGLPGSSAYVSGGIVAYSNEAKQDLLGVPAELIETEGAVSPPVAEAMARGALRALRADLAVAITGVAGPGGGTAEKPVGYVCFCVAEESGRILARDLQLPGRRADVRERSVSVAMHMVHRLLTGAGLPEP